MEYPSQVLNRVIDHFASLPGIGKKTAVRLVLDLLYKEQAQILNFSESLKKLALEINYCKHCHAISDDEVCKICSNPAREDDKICVVEDIRDIVAIEQTVQFRGRYHVLGGLISPIKGIAPSDLNIGSLLERLAENPQIKEIIFALSTDIDGDTTHFYLYKKLKDKPIVLSTIARGISMGDSITYADEVTLGKSILHRVPLETVFNT